MIINTKKHPTTVTSHLAAIKPLTVLTITVHPYVKKTTKKCLTECLGFSSRVIRVGKFVASEISSAHMRSNNQYLLETLPQI